VSRRVFLDTSGWLSVLATRERRHKASLGVYRRVLEAGSGFVTTNLVIAEMYLLLTRYRGADAALQFLDALKRDAAHEVHFVTPALQERAVDRWLRPFADHGFSLADATSFELMRELGLTQAMALDQHFSVAGFERIPAAE
jgi:predicted nucleic acid-binding protein